jgi:hypothetical protein
LVIGFLDLEIVWDWLFEIWNLEIESLFTIDDERLSISQSLSKRANPLYPHLAHASGGSVYEGVPGPPEEIFFLGDVQES